ncbi:MAG: DUF721 domain-containing protein [candidate division NC10 bacterium]|nr:DUF721 domain-containing protein [candidate division NC10 bacterium]
MRGSRRRESPVKLSTALDEVLRGLGLEGVLKEVTVRRLWEEVVGPGISRRAQPEDFRGGRLRVRVSDSVWLHQLSLMRPRIIAQLNQRMGEGMVKEIYLSIGKVDRPPPKS